MTPLYLSTFSVYNELEKLYKIRVKKGMWLLYEFWIVKTKVSNKLLTADNIIDYMGCD